VADDPLRRSDFELERDASRPRRLRRAFSLFFVLLGERYRFSFASFRRQQMTNM
jgi:hypothetical protein